MLSSKKTVPYKNSTKDNSKNTSYKCSSDNLFNQMKFNSFTKIFKELDQDEDKLISIVSISFHKLPSAIKNILQPIILKLKEENCVINEDDFLVYCDAIYEVYNLIIYALTTDKRQIFLNFGKNNSFHQKTLNTSYSFKVITHRIN